MKLVQLGNWIFKFYFILIDLNLNSYMWLVAIELVSTGTERKVEVRTQGYTFEEGGGPYKRGRDGVLTQVAALALEERRWREGSVHGQRSRGLC